MKDWYSHYCMCVKKPRKEQEREFKYDLSKAKGNCTDEDRI